jgi:hypothetical protein
MAVIDRISLDVAYAMGVVTGRAWCSLVHYMLFVLAETLVSQNAVPVVAFIAHGVVSGVLLGKVLGIVVFFQEILIDGAMGTSWRIWIISIMAVYAGYNTLGCQWGQKAWHIRVGPL